MYKTKAEAVAAGNSLDASLPWGDLWDKFGGAFIALAIEVLKVILSGGMKSAKASADDACCCHCECIARLSCIIGCANKEIGEHLAHCCDAG
jgi:hypothetical protein